MDDNDELGQEQQFRSFVRMWLAIQEAAGRGELDWDDLNEEDQVGVQDAFTVCQRTIAESVDTPYDTIARTVYESWQRVASPTSAAWQDADQETKLLWNTMVRHTVNVMSLDPEDGGPEEHEENMLARFTDNLRTIRGTNEHSHASTSPAETPAEATATSG
jgi:hypothetical protein